MNDDGLRALLRSADPASSMPPADPEGLARLLEDTMAHDTEPRTESRASGLRGRSPLTWLVAAAACVIIVGVGLAALFAPWRDGATGPGADGSETAAPAAATRLDLPDAAAGRCATPSAEMLAVHDLALRAFVVAIEGRTVVLEPQEVYAGEVSETVEIMQPDAGLVDLIGAPSFEVGGTYLLAASDGRVAVCGFSGPATPALQRLYAEAFAR